MKKDTIYNTLETKVSEKDFEDFFNQSYYSEEELKIVEKTAYMVNQATFRKLFQMIRLNIIQPLDLTEVTNFNAQSLSIWIDKKIKDANFFDYQSINLNALVAIDKQLSPLPVTFARYPNTEKTFKDFLFAFDYYSVANTDNSYRSKANFISDFNTKMGLNDPHSELNSLITALNEPFDFSEVNDYYVSTMIELLYGRVFTQDIIGSDTLPGIFSVERLHDLCFCSTLNLSNLQIYRSFFIDLINWRFPYKNFKDIREYLGKAVMDWFRLNNLGDDDFEGIPESLYEQCQEDIDGIANSDNRISFYSLNRALVLLCYLQSINHSRGVNWLVSLFDRTIFNKISLVNQILNFIKNNVYALKHIKL